MRTVKKVMTYAEAKAYIKKFNLKNQEEYDAWWLLNEEECKEIGLPKNPVKVYGVLPSVSEEPKTFVFPNASEIHSTYDYHMFKRIDGNRTVTEQHVKHLMLSFQKKYLLSPILVNKDMGVLDGQTRLEAAKRLGYPVNYIVDGDGGLSDIQTVNSVTVNWNKTDYLDSYCEKGLSAYLRLKEFMVNNPEFPISVAEGIVGNNINNTSSNSSVHSNAAQRFKDGLFEIPDLGLAYEYAGKIREFKPFFESFNSHKFIRALIKLFRNPDYNQDEMIRRLKMKTEAKKLQVLVFCATTKQYISLLEEIYNYRSQSPVNLRYAKKVKKHKSPEEKIAYQKKYDATHKEERKARLARKNLVYETV